MEKRSFGAIVLGGFTAIILSAQGAGAQVLTPSGFAGACKITNQEAIAILQGGRQTLALEARFEFVSTDSQVALAAPPERLGWVIPVPAGTTLAELPAATVFSDLYQLSHPPAKQKYKLHTGRPSAMDRFGGNLFGGSGFPSADTTLAWTLIEGSGEAALAALKDWIAKQGFAGLSEELAKDYAEEGWTFAVGLAEGLGDSGLLGPAAFEFSSEEVVLPLRFQADAGEFDLTLYVVSDRVLDTRSLSGWRISGVNDWEREHRDAWFKGYVELSQAGAPESLTAYVDLFRPPSAEGATAPPLYFHVFSAAQLNGFGRTTARQSADFGLPEKGKTSQRLSGRKTTEEERRDRLRRMRQRNYIRNSR